MNDTPEQFRRFPDQVEVLFDTAAQIPVMVTRPGKSDVVVLSADAYAALLDHAQLNSVMNSDTMGQDPMLSDLAAMAKDPASIPE